MADKVNEVMTLGFKRLDENATIPTKAHATDSGFDLYASEDVIIEPGETAVVPTGIAVQMPEGFEAQVRPRSGVTSKTKLRVQLGTIDRGYNGEIGIIVDNNHQHSVSCEVTPKQKGFNTLDGGKVESNRGYCGNEYEGTYLIRKGDRLAQLVVQHLPEVVAEEITEFDGESQRGSAGFGSTGVID